MEKKRKKTKIKTGKNKERRTINLKDRFWIKASVTIAALFLVQLGNIFPIPTINSTYFQYLVRKTDLLGMVNRFSGGSFSKMTIFALGISIYISSSIIVQLLTVVFRKMEQYERSGAYGKKQLERITIYFSVFMSIISSLSFSLMLRNYGILKNQKVTTFLLTAFFLCIGSLILIALGKIIDERGIGNGITVILMMNLIAYIPTDINTIYHGFFKGHSMKVRVATIIVIAVLILLSILMNKMEKRLHLQYSNAPIKNEVVDQAAYLSIGGRLISVMPVILVSTIFQMLSMVMLFAEKTNVGWYQYFNMSNWFQKGSLKFTLGYLVYLILMVFFAYFYVSITFNAYQLNQNFRKEGITVDDKRPGTETIAFLKKSVRQIIWISIGILFVIVTVPMVVTGMTKVTTLNIGGTTIIIIVGAMLETIRSLKGEWLTSKYEKKKWL